MPNEDAERWNRRYLDDPRASFEEPRPFLVENAGYLPNSGLALDLAMGLGGNAGFLLERGLNVIGVDVSEVAVRRAKRRWPGLMAAVIDLTRFTLPAGKFDLIVNFFYLQRELWPEIRHALRPGGVVIYETLTQEMRTVNPEIDPVYLLKPGELLKAFSDLEILVYQEGWVEVNGKRPRAVASLAARASLS